MNMKTALPCFKADHVLLSHKNIFSCVYLIKLIVSEKRHKALVMQPDNRPCHMDADISPIYG